MFTPAILFDRKTTRTLVITGLAALVLATGCSAPGSQFETSTALGTRSCVAAPPSADAPLMAVLTAPAATGSTAAARAQAYDKVLAAATAETAYLLLDTLGGGTAGANLVVNQSMAGAGNNPLERDLSLECLGTSAAAGYAQLTAGPAAVQDTAKPYDVFTSLDILQGHLSGVPRSRTDVVLLGDLTNRVGPIDLTDPATLAAPEVAVERVRADGLVKDCAGWNVYAVASTTSDGKNAAQLREFYRALLAACGGTLVLWDPALPAFPLPGARVQPVVFSAPPPIPEFITTASATTAPLPSALLFDSGSAILRPEADAALGDVRKAAAAYPTGGIAVRAYTDDVGTAQDNLRLSMARADEVCRWLTARGIDPGRLSPSGYGESDPAQPGTSEQARQTNRRVVIVIQHQAT